MSQEVDILTSVENPQGYTQEEIEVWYKDYIDFCNDLRRKRNSDGGGYHIMPGKHIMYR